MAAPLMKHDLGRPIRVVFVGGAFLEPTTLEFLAQLDEHPEVEFLGGFCQSGGFELRERVASVFRRRGLLAPAVLGVYAAQAVLRFARRPRAELALRRRIRRPLSRVATAPDIHAPVVLEQMRALAPDLGVIYGAPMLKPRLFEIPRFGTLGVHHGKLPKYRGMKTAFWAMCNGEKTAGVTIQRINAGVDTGEVVAEAEIPIAGRRYGPVDTALHELGVELFMKSVVAVKRGEAVCRPQERGDFPLCRQPVMRDILRLWRRQLTLGPRGG